MILLQILLFEIVLCQQWILLLHANHGTTIGLVSLQPLRQFVEQRLELHEEDQRRHGHERLMVEQHLQMIDDVNDQAKRVKGEFQVVDKVGTRFAGRCQRRLFLVFELIALKGVFDQQVADVESEQDGFGKHEEEY